MSDATVGRYPPVTVSPKQFETLITELMHTEGSGLEDVRVQHGETLHGADGEYVIDTSVRFRVLGGAELLVLVEAKLQNRPVERTVTQKLFQIVLSTGAHKGIIVSTSGFQRGALDFAGAHGIALVQLVDGQMTYKTRSVDSKPQFVPGLPEFVAYQVAATPTGHTTTMLTGQPNYLEELLA
jgi:restriction system protein